MMYLQQATKQNEKKRQESITRNVAILARMPDAFTASEFIEASGIEKSLAYHRLSTMMLQNLLVSMGNGKGKRYAKTGSIP